MRCVLSAGLYAITVIWVNMFFLMVLFGWIDPLKVLYTHTGVVSCSGWLEPCSGLNWTNLCCELCEVTKYNAVNSKGIICPAPIGRKCRSNTVCTCLHSPGKKVSLHGQNNHLCVFTMGVQGLSYDQYNDITSSQFWGFQHAAYVIKWFRIYSGIFNNDQTLDEIYSQSASSALYNICRFLFNTCILI